MSRPASGRITQSQTRVVIPAIPKAFGRSGILLAVGKDSGRAGMTGKKRFIIKNNL